MPLTTNSDPTPLAPEYGDQLLELARASIDHGLTYGGPLEVDPLSFPEPLQVERATFVTLIRDHDLRGCIGSLEAYRPLVADVVANAFSSAFSDPRFPPLTRAEFDRLEIHISILSPPVEIRFDSEADLISQLQPGVDGLILIAENHRGTFLPSVWEQLPQPQEFIHHLKLKAGLRPDYWSDDVQVFRYTAQAIP